MHKSGMLAAAVASLFMAVTTGAQAAGPFDPFRVGNWKAGAYTSNSTGQFSHCAATVNYSSGVVVAVHITRDAKWRVGFGHRNWNLTRGRILPIALTFDGVGPVNVRGLAISNKVAFVPMPNNSRLIGLFRGATRMNMFAGGNVFNFRLDGTKSLLPALARCVARNRGAR